MLVRCFWRARPYFALLCTQVPTDVCETPSWDITRNCGRLTRFAFRFEVRRSTRDNGCTCCFASAPRDGRGARGLVLTKNCCSTLCYARARACFMRKEYRKPHSFPLATVEPVFGRKAKNRRKTLRSASARRSRCVFDMLVAKCVKLYEVWP